MAERVGLPEADEGLVDVPEVEQREPQVVERPGVGRLARDEVEQEGRRRRVLPGAAESRPEVVRGLRLPGRDPERLPVGGERLRQTPARVGLASPPEGVAVARGKGQASLSSAWRFARATASARLESFGRSSKIRPSRIRTMRRACAAMSSS